MADDHAARRPQDGKMLHLEEGWEAELWRSAYGVTRFRLAQAMPGASTGEAPAMHDDG